MGARRIAPRALAFHLGRWFLLVPTTIAAAPFFSGLQDFLDRHTDRRRLLAPLLAQRRTARLPHLTHPGVPLAGAALRAGENSSH